MSSTHAPTPLRIPPHSLDSEQALLGGLLLAPSAWDAIADKVREDDFYRRDHRALFHAIAVLSEQGKPCDTVTLGDWLADQDLLEVSGGTAYMAELQSRSAGAANLVAYAEVVRETSILRQLIDTGTAIVTNATGAQADVDDILESAEQAVFRLSEAGVRAGHVAQPIHYVLRETIDVLRRRAAAAGELAGLSSGFPDLDALTAGFQPADLIIVASRPAMGKTSFALGIAEHLAARERKPVAIFSLEMSATQLTFRLFSSMGRLDQQRLRLGTLEEAEWTRLTHAMGMLSDVPLFIDDTPALSAVELRSRARRIAREHGLSMIVVDYLQLMHVSGHENRATEVAAISRGLKALAKELNVPVVALSQLNRSLEQRKDKRPLLSDLRESGGIEQDADLVMFIYRDEYYHHDSADKGTAEIIISKQRNGPTGTVRLAFIGEQTRFDSLSQDDYQPVGT